MLRLPALVPFLSFLAYAATDTPPALRLDDSARPVRYAADLTLDPGATSFSGSIQIEVDLLKPSSLIWMNGTGIHIEAATVTAGGKTIPATVVPGGTDFLGLRLAGEAPRGAAKIDIRYRGAIGTRNSAGIFQGKDAGNAYLFTQFESTDARRAFPCFDQPGFKTPWRLTLHVKRELGAFANTPAASETEEAGGMKKVEFVETKPLPSYLVAFAVGPFDVVDGGTAGRNHTPIRILAPKGKAGQAVYAAQITGRLLEELERYFGTAFPYPKLDAVAVPLTFGFGAMENAGFITYAQTIILADPAVDTDRRRRRYASVAAHEMAHQWFGDLVTLSWWDDIWLNEAFATWTSSKIVAEWKPEWNSRLEDLNGKFGAMREDSLVSARQIRQPINTKDDISNAFDGITYEKGAAVIRMFETWVGPQRFQQGVRAYLKRYAYKNASLNDFLDAISGAGEPGLTKAFKTFLEQPGVPLISATLRCDGAPAVALSQKRFLPLGSKGDASKLWEVPVCVGYPSASGETKECFLLDKPSEEFRLRKTTTCPATLNANAGAAGYYIADYQGGLLGKLLAGGQASLDPAERRTLLNDLQSLADAGEIAPSRALAAVPAFAQAPEREIVAQAQQLVAGTKPFLDPALHANYARFIREVFGERAERLGWSAAPGDDAETRLLRAGLVPFVAGQGEDPALTARARKLADGWLATGQGVDSDMRSGVLATAARFGDRAYFDGLVAGLEKTTDRQLRRSMIEALGSFRDPKLVRASLDLMLHSRIDMRETAFLLFGPLGDRATDRMPFEFVKANYDAIVAKAPSGGGFEFGAVLPVSGRALCDESSLKTFENFFEDRSKKFTGGPRNYSQVVESIRLCIAKKTAQSADIDRFFQGK